MVDQLSQRPWTMVVHVAGGGLAPRPHLGVVELQSGQGIDASEARGPLQSARKRASKRPSGKIAPPDAACVPSCSAFCCDLMALRASAPPFGELMQPLRQQQRRVSPDSKTGSGLVAASESPPHFDLDGSSSAAQKSNPSHGWQEEPPWLYERRARPNDPDHVPSLQSFSS